MYTNSKLNSIVLNGLEEGQFVVSLDNEGNKIFAVNIDRKDRRSNTAAFITPVVKEIPFGGRGFYRTGFYPVRIHGGLHLGFYDEKKEVIYMITSFYADSVRAGEVIDLDRGRFEREVLRHLNHIEAENRRLRHEVSSIRKDAEKTPEKETPLGWPPTVNTFTKGDDEDALY